MKINLNDLSEMSEDISQQNVHFEKFKSKRKKLSSIKSLRNLQGETSEGNVSKLDLENFINDGIVDELISIIKTGKEASVYLGKNYTGYIAVKVYTDLRVRSFKKDNVYRQGRFIGSMRIEKAIQQSSEFGLNARQVLWVNEEFRQMKFLHDAEVPVPKPIANSGLMVAMEFIGSGNESAPRLSDLKLDKEEGEFAFEQSLKILKSVLETGRVHGDFSAYNLLWHNEKSFLIDFPQVVEIKNNPHAVEILFRDINSFCKSFERHKVKSDPEKIFREMRGIIRRLGLD